MIEKFGSSACDELACPELVEGVESEMRKFGSEKSRKGK
jgi:hypothetical protein